MLDLSVSTSVAQMPPLN